MYILGFIDTYAKLSVNHEGIIDMTASSSATFVHAS